MGFRMTYKELDPRLQSPAQQQLVDPNQYYDTYRQLQQQALQTKLSQEERWAQAEGQRQAANIAGEHPIINALPGALNAALSSAKTVQGMKNDQTRLAEEQATGAANRALTMEQTLGAQQTRGLNAQYSPQERQANIASTQAGTGLTTAQAEGAGTQNAISKIDLANKETERNFAASDAQQAGFSGAKPGETIQSYGMRMKAEGNIAEIERIKTESETAKANLKYLPEKMRNETLLAKAQIAQSYAGAEASRTQSTIAKQTFALQNYQNKQAQVEKEMQDATSYIKANNLSPQDAVKYMSFRFQGISQKLGIPIDSPAIADGVASALTKMDSVDKAASVQRMAALKLTPGFDQAVDAKLKIKNTANNASEILSSMQQFVQQFKQGVSSVKDSDAAVMAGNAIQNKLDSAAAQDPATFKAYADQFRKINAGVYTSNIGDMFGAAFDATLGTSRGTQAEHLLNQMAMDLTTQLSAHAGTDPEASRFIGEAEAVRNLKINAGNNPFFGSIGTGGAGRTAPQPLSPASTMPVSAPVPSATVSPGMAPLTMNNMQQPRRTFPNNLDPQLAAGGRR